MTGWRVEEVEGLRRSIAMLPPLHPAALDRETALVVLAALEDALRRLGER
ncbi:MAG TPA: hypothetical protein VGB14_00775 [Acidimicrobiales bacterium]|jgi:hypothetical protein